MVYLLICTIPFEFLHTNIGTHTPVHRHIFVVARFCWFVLLWVVSQRLYFPDPLEEGCFNVKGVDWPLFWCTKSKHYLYAFSWASWAVSTVVLFLLEATRTEASFGSWFIVDDFWLYNPAKWNKFLTSVLNLLVCLSGFPLLQFSQFLYPLTEW